MTKKIALVTGSSRGIGFGILKELCHNGYTGIMTCTALHETASKALAELRGDGYDVDCIPCDISDSDARMRLFDEVMQRFGRLDVLVNNAGVTLRERTDILKTTEESFDHVIDTNLKGTFFMCRLASNLMISLKESETNDYLPRIINISSISAYTSSRNRAEYCVSKAGISMCTKLFADRLADWNIPVFEVRPGIIRTDMTSGAAVIEKYDKLIAEGLTPLKRWGTPQDIADAVITLASGKLDFATGQVINADGGFHLRRL